MALLENYFRSCIRIIPVKASIRHPDENREPVWIPASAGMAGTGACPGRRSEICWNYGDVPSGKKVETCSKTVRTLKFNLNRAVNGFFG